ncbi:helix-turn-helix transcriptional regulator [Microbacterium aquilitoris]|uniref:helix-turn-helix transcriptional regulator n=1 Tax=Microbacterium aquilitoris TaxID=3067307 RepID=UPI0028927C8E|nr:helix-turn-helix transcriptional regulator [Microbacterium sp. KSW2-22]MDT3343763.1 helix-turn-helix transcriptional regulator [Microbacterium sp. KSW2-22]
MAPGRPERHSWDHYASTLGRNLQIARDRAGLSQEAVAYASGLSRYTYQKLERGIARPGAAANPTLKTLIAICQTLDVRPEDILPAEAPDLSAR